MSEQNKVLVRKFYEEVINNKNVDAFDELCSPDFVDHTAAPGQAPGLQGMKDGFAIFHRAFPDQRVNIEEIVAERDIVVTRFSVTAMHKGEIMGAPPTGKYVTFHAIDVFRIRGGKVAEAWHQGDDLMVLMQLGARPPM
jgi:steroid delta-isomerase-like uncharacterized protein